MICGVEARSFENDPYRQKDFMERILLTFRAAHQWFIVKTLLPVELHPTIFAPISINRHAYLAYYLLRIIVPNEEGIKLIYIRELLDPIRKSIFELVIDRLFHAG